MHYSIYSTSTPLRSNASISFIAADPEVRSRLLWCTFTESPESSPLLATSGPRSLISLSFEVEFPEVRQVGEGAEVADLVILEVEFPEVRQVGEGAEVADLVILEVEFPEVCQVGEGAKIADLVTFEVEFLEIRQVGEGAKIADLVIPEVEFPEASSGWRGGQGR
jgi:hypothetical protein